MCRGYFYSFLGVIFLGIAKFQIIFVVLEIPDIFWGERQMLGPSLRMMKK